MVFNLGFQEKHILNLWCMLSYSAKVSLKIFESFKVISAYCVSLGLSWFENKANKNIKTFQWNCDMVKKHTSENILHKITDWRMCNPLVRQHSWFGLALVESGRIQDFKPNMFWISKECFFYLAMVLLTRPANLFKTISAYATKTRSKKLN